MHTLHIVLAENAPSIVRPVKAVRETLKYLGYEPDLQGCQEVVRRAQDEGYTLLAQDPDIIMIQKAATLVEEESGGTLGAFVDKDEAWLKTRFKPIEVPDDVQAYADEAPAKPVELAPTDAGYRGVIVLLAGANGDVAKTMETILNLKANFPDNQLWPEALVSLAAVHPWVRQVAQQVGQWPS